MISVIICSASPDDLLLVKTNIEQTIGVPYEILAFDNGDAQKGICEIYNEGTRAAQYGILCFMHEDIEMVSQRWGEKVIEIFEKNTEFGLVGLAGGGYKSVVPSSWYNADLEVNGEFYCSLIQGFKYSGREEFYDYRNPKNENLSRVACIDGCWMCTRKTIAEKYPFDAQLLRHFHGYDLDFSLSVNQQYQVGVSYEILLKHFSEGNFSEAWLEDTLKVHKKWSHLLPVNTDNLEEKTLKRYERRAFKAFFNRMLDSGMSYKRLRKIIWDSRKSRIFPLRILIKIYLDLQKVRKKRRREGKAY
ncbi:glycosyltransferase [Dyadobacter psychrotolerans]|uniref:Streptomycin biosynthesis protein StrF domain-containing protein n=1 Tax=Dyadobacter psychrotolerans TaxID=2541721 RepID=A0A4V2Z467_9BACT|nr:glycosyltransferase [Dyadobacter psychrotolerans]TDE15438.1 hypothetical protein E0F88_13070 [Dyadobacter psychrotolerans]